MKVLKKQLGEVLKLQGARLERAMVNHRRWSAADFQRWVVGHPVMTLLARGLVWGTYDDAGTLVSTFRIAEDPTLATEEDEGFELPQALKVGIPHPLTLPEPARAAWAERLSDYELSPPFPQLGRPTARPLAEERDQLESTRFNGIPCLAIGLVDGLDRRGWLRDSAEDGGCFCRHLRPFPAAAPDGLVAVLRYEPGVAIWDIRNADDQQIQGVAFYRGDMQAVKDLPEKRRVPLGKVDPVVFSEVMSDLAALTSHGR